MTTNKKVILLDRFTSAGRSIYCNHLKKNNRIMPDVAIGYYKNWGCCHALESYALEEITKERSPTTKHLWLKNYEDFLEDYVNKNRNNFIVMAWFETNHLINLAHEFNGVICAAPKKIRDFIENKFNLNFILENSGVDKNIIISSKNLEANDLANQESMKFQFGDKFVLQNDISSGGNGTFIIQNDKDLSSIDVKKKWKISKFIIGDSSNVSAVNYRDVNGKLFVMVDYPSYKPIGISDLGIKPTKGAGNDWSREWSEATILSINNTMTKIGNFLYFKYGLLGLWGADFIIDDRGNPKINELNIRNQGTTEVSSLNQILRNIDPFLLIHFNVFSGVKQKPIPEESIDSLRKKTKKSPFYIKIRNNYKDGFLDRDYNGPGIYKLDLNKKVLVWQRHGKSALDADFTKHEVLLANFPTHDCYCLYGSEIGTIEGLTDTPIFHNNKLSSLGEDLLVAIEHFIS